MKRNMDLFADELRKLVSRRIRELKKEGTVAIGNDCLWQCITGRLERECPNAPVGTNCAGIARGIFNQVIANNLFVYQQ